MLPVSAAAARLQRSSGDGGDAGGPLLLGLFSLDTQEGRCTQELNYKFLRLEHKEVTMAALGEQQGRTDGAQPSGRLPCPLRFRALAPRLLNLQNASRAEYNAFTALSTECAAFLPPEAEAGRESGAGGGEQSGGKEQVMDMAECEAVRGRERALNASAYRLEHAFDAHLDNVDALLQQLGEAEAERDALAAEQAELRARLAAVPPGVPPSHSGSA